MAVHHECIAVASVAQAPGAAVVSFGTLGTRPCDRAKRRRPLPSQGPPLVFVYDAGPCGDWLSRSLTKPGDVCWVVAPSVMPHKPGARVNTARRDARPLARLRRSGDRTPGSGPAVDDEASRDLRRAREESRRDLQAATWRLHACWLRHDRRSTGRAHWRPAHRRWLRAVGCPTPAQPMVLQDYVHTVTEQTARWPRLEHALHDPVPSWRFQAVVEALQAVWGVQCTGAVTMVAERGDLTRVENPRQLMHDVGVTPAAYSRGPRRPQGSMTTTGHTQARRALVAGAWADRSPATVSRHLPRRLEQLPPAIQAIRWQAHGRLCTRSRQLMANGHQAKQVVVAMARARRACMGAMATPVVVPPNAERSRRVDAPAGEVSTRSRQRRRPGVGSPSAA